MASITFFPSFLWVERILLSHLARVFAMRNRALIYPMLSLFITLVTACAQLPEYAKPRTIQIDENVIITSFTYRQLTREDFRASSFPAYLPTHEENINAHSAITIRITGDSNISIIPQHLLDQNNYLGRINHLAFEAVMIPDKSWWNPKMKAGMTTYVLQHEQIHFALTEIAARKLTRDARKWSPNLSVIKQTPQEVYSEILQQVKVRVNSTMEANQKRHLKFDNDTSLFYSPLWQAWWLEMVEKELKQTESGIHGR